MIGQLRGKVVYRGEQGVIIDVSGVGYEVQMPTSAIALLPPDDSEVIIHTHMIWREDNVSLFGFSSRSDREIFKCLLNVSGVGPRLAISLLSSLSGEELLNTLAHGDLRRLQSVHGVGKKTAARLCVDLKERARQMLQISDNMAALDRKADTGGDILEDAVSALLNLGYSISEIKQILHLVPDDVKSGTDLKGLIAWMLKLLSRNLSHGGREGR